MRNVCLAQVRISVIAKHSDFQVRYDGSKYITKEGDAHGYDGHVFFLQRHTLQLHSDARGEKSKNFFDSRFQAVEIEERVFWVRERPLFEFDIQFALLLPGRETLISSLPALHLQADSLASAGHPSLMANAIMEGLNDADAPHVRIDVNFETHGISPAGTIRFCPEIAVAVRFIAGSPNSPPRAISDWIRAVDQAYGDAAMAEELEDDGLWN